MEKSVAEPKEPGCRKVCLYLGDVAQEIDEAAAKLGMSRSKLLVEAWKRAKDRIAAIPGTPTPTP